jgi:hypothetical protein
MLMGKYHEIPTPERFRGHEIRHGVVEKGWLRAVDTPAHPAVILSVHA